MSKVARYRCAIAVPVFDGSVLRFQELRETIVGAVSWLVTPCFDRGSRFHAIARISDSVEPAATGSFQGACLRFALCVFDFQVYPGMRDNEVHFFDPTFE